MREDDLAARCRSGDIDAFSEAYALFERQVFRHAYYLLGNAEDADDAKQDTFLRAYRGMPGFRGQSSLQSWLLRICGNLCADRLRQQARRAEILCDPQALDQDDLHPPVHPADAVCHADTADRVMRVLMAMPVPQRRLVVLHLLEDRGCAEVAEILGSSVGATRMRLVRAMRMFRARARAALQDLE